MTSSCAGRRCGSSLSVTQVVLVQTHQMAISNTSVWNAPLQCRRWVRPYEN